MTVNMQATAVPLGLDSLIVPLSQYACLYAR